MTETKVEISKRKIRTGLRKQAEALQRIKKAEQQKVWNRLKEIHKPRPHFEVSWQSVVGKSRQLKANWIVEESDDIIDVYDGLDFSYITETVDKNGKVIDDD